MIAAGGFLFYAVFRYLSMITSDWYKDLRYDWLRSDVRLLVFVYLVIAVVILFGIDKIYLNYLWITCAIFAEYYLFQTADGTMLVISMRLFVVVGIMLFFDCKKLRVRITVLLLRIAWIALFIAFSIFIAYLFKTYPERFRASIVFYSAVVFMLLYTMAMSMVSLNIFAGFISKLFFVPSLLAVCCAFSTASKGDAKGVLVNILSYVPLAGEIVSCSAYCLYLAFLNRNKKLKNDLAVKRPLMAVPVIVLIAAIFAGNYNSLYSKDIGVRQGKAEQTYRALIYQNTDYNWYDIYGEKSLVKTKDLTGSIQLLDDDSMPVLFLSGGMVSEADGTTRMLIYDEGSGKAKAVLGAWHSITIDGYCRADEDHKYPVIYCHGGHMGLVNELIYELRGNEPVLIGAAQINDMPESDVPDEYTWNGQSISKEDYNTKRDQILKGYKEIEWKAIWE